MRVLLAAPVLVIVVAAGGLLACTVGGVNPHVRDMLIAAAVVTVACVASALPLWLSSGSDQAGAAQAGLVATMAHLFVSVAIAAVVFLTLRAGLPFTLWMLAMYWATLIVVVVAAIRVVRAAPAGAGVDHR
jgi:hypothetical protein